MVTRKSKQSRGGVARAAKLTPEERSVSARHAAGARWAAKPPGDPPRFVQITGYAVTLRDGVGADVLAEGLYALDAAGDVWRFEHATARQQRPFWSRVGMRKVP